MLGAVREVGFDSVTHYVFLPDWKGPPLQDYADYKLRVPSGIPFIKGYQYERL